MQKQSIVRIFKGFLRHIGDVYNIL